VVPLALDVPLRVAEVALDQLVRQAEEGLVLKNVREEGPKTDESVNESSLTSRT
jgi:hypothetical protein